ncbi:MAG: methylated-DNA--[protein]-cysteine S-methyltransferase [candidate division Zixibacteria bacterium]|nr:methylated-DNA--[protein]-cysteine S-methyltransferase [candidate division Zixibacteria bacterium]
MKCLFVHQFSTRFGRFQLAETEKGIAVIGLPTESSTRFLSVLAKKFDGYKIAQGGSENRKAEKQIQAYLRGKLKKFSLRLDLRGTPFQRKVLRQVAAIPYGRTKTYGAIAIAIGLPGAARAVGMANARNLHPLIIPCHRVVASNGLGGYGGGLKLKKQLLEIENIKIC